MGLLERLPILRQPAFLAATCTEARNRHLPCVLLRCGISPREAEKLNVGDVYTGRRVRSTLVLEDPLCRGTREVPLSRSVRESLAVILDCTQCMGYSLDPLTPLFLQLSGEDSGASSRLTHHQIQRILASVPA